MEELIAFGNLVLEKGLGVASFIVLVFFGYRAAGFAANFVENHMHHIQASLDKLTENSSEANKKLDQQTTKLDEILRK